MRNYEGCNEQVFSRAERVQDEQAKQRAKPSIMMLCTNIYEHCTVTQAYTITTICTLIFILFNHQFSGRQFARKKGDT